MNIDDVNGPDGPFWDDYQAERRRERITDNPDRVPDWFLARLAVRRVAAARVETERTPPDDLGCGRGVFEALRTVEHFLQFGGSGYRLDPARAVVVAALLGAEEVEIARDRGELPHPYERNTVGATHWDCRICGQGPDAAVHPRITAAAGWVPRCGDRVTFAGLPGVISRVQLYGALHVTLDGNSGTVDTTAEHLTPVGVGRPRVLEGQR